MLKEIENYLSLKVKTCLQGYAEHLDGFNIDNVSLPSKGKAFHVLTDSINSHVYNHNCLEETYSTSIHLFLKNDRNIKNIIHLGMEDARCLSVCLIKDFLGHRVVSDANPFSKIKVETIDANFQDSNDDLIRIKILLSLTTNRKIEME